MIKKYLILFLVFSICKAKGQTLFYQQNIKGGVSFDSHSFLGWGGTYLQADSFYFANTIPSGAIIKKAFLTTLTFIYNLNTPFTKQDTFTVELNNNQVLLSNNDFNSVHYHFDIINPYNDCWIQIADVTNYVLPNNNYFKMKSQAFQQIWHGRETVSNSWGLIIIYEDLSMSNTNVAITLLDKTYLSYNTYQIKNLNPILNTNDVGLSYYGVNVQAANPSNETFISFNQGSTTLLGSINGLYDSTKVGGSFDYHNNTLTALADDDVNLQMDSTDALSNIKSIVNNNSTTFNMLVTAPTSYGLINAHQMFILAYTTNCPTSPTFTNLMDTTICYGNAVQLNCGALNGGSVKWYPKAGLNDSTIANPIATPSKTTDYIAYVKDAQGCMYTQQHKIIVHQPPMPDTVIVKKEVCGVNKGTINLAPPDDYNNPYTYDIGSGFVNDTSFTNLSTGTYTLIVKDNLGCTYQTNVTVPFLNTVNASFTAYPNPLTGLVPFQTVYINNSANANNYNWYFPTDTLYTIDPSYTFTQAGTYTVTLLATNNDPNCFDTASVVVIVEDSLKWFMPNVFTPNNDDNNDLFIIKPYYYNNISYTIYDRWGKSVVCVSDVTFTTLYVSLWDGKIKGCDASEGTYYYVIELKGKNDKKLNLTGYIELLR